MTSIEIADDGNGALVMTVNKDANNLPLTNFKFSTDTPCIDYAQEPLSAAGTFKDEYTSSAKGCVKDEDYDTALNTNWRRVGTFSLN